MHFNLCLANTPRWSYPGYTPQYPVLSTSTLPLPHCRPSSQSPPIYPACTLCAQLNFQCNFTRKCLRWQRRRLEGGETGRDPGYLVGSARARARARTRLVHPVKRHNHHNRIDTTNERVARQGRQGRRGEGKPRCVCAAKKSDTGKEHFYGFRRVLANAAISAIHRLSISTVRQLSESIRRKWSTAQ